MNNSYLKTVCNFVPYFPLFEYACCVYVCSFYLCTVFTTQKSLIRGLPMWSSSEDLVLPMQGAQFPSLVSEL